MINLTPHAIVIRAADGNTTTIAPSGTIARVAMVETLTDLTVAGAPVIRRQPGEVDGLPEDGTPCLVSSMVLAAVPAGTVGIYAPDTGPTAVRDDAGRIVAVTRLVAA